MGNGAHCAAALQLARRGMNVFPCRRQGKEPATPHGCLDATIDPAVIEAWWENDPLLNVAVATGEASNLVVIDLDGNEAESALRRIESEHGKLPDTVAVKTPRGRHLWLRHPDKPVPNSASKIGPKIDVRGRGGYVIAPPSIHPCLKRYFWQTSANAIADPPSWLVDLIITPATSTSATPVAAPSSEWRDLFQRDVPMGSRDCTVAKLAGHLLRRWIDPVVALELLQAWNATRCVPPLPAADIERIVGSIAGKELRRRQGGASS